MELKRYLILSDVHHPFCNEAAYRLVLSYAKDLKPDQIIINGDFADFYNINFYGKSPNVQEKFSDEIDCVVRELRILKEICDDIVYVEGNHEFRLLRYVNEKCPDIGKFISVEQMLFLPSMGVKFVSFGPTQLYKIGNTETYIRHRPLGGGQHCSYQTLVKAQRSVIFGDAHRIQKYHMNSIDGVEIEAHGVGWLGDKKSEVFGYVQSHHQWQLGFCVVTEYDGRAYVENIHIKERDGSYSFIADSNLYLS